MIVDLTDIWTESTKNMSYLEKLTDQFHSLFFQKIGHFGRDEKYIMYEMKILMNPKVAGSSPTHATKEFYKPYKHYVCKALLVFCHI